MIFNLKYFSAVVLTFEWLSSLFEPWLIPLTECQRHETAAWIQQFAESTKIMFPWAPGDAKSVEPMLVVFSDSVTYLDERLPGAKRSALSQLLELYCTRFAQPAIKDFVLSPVHTQWLALGWQNFVPREDDMSRMAATLDTFVPLSHEFLGKIFIKLSWESIFASSDTVIALAPYFLHVLVKLSSEPQIRLVRSSIPFTVLSYRTLTIVHSIESRTSEAFGFGSGRPNVAKRSCQSIRKLDALVHYVG